MPPTPSRFALKSRFLFPVSSPPIDGGVITIDGSQIAAVGENRSGSPPHDLGDVAILPGLVNAHAHLEFSDLKQPLGFPGIAFPDWISEIVAWRRNEVSDRDPSQTRNKGFRESLTNGVTTLGDIVTIPEIAPHESACRCVAFREFMGLTNDRRLEQMEVARSLVAEAKKEPGYRLALSPHAPYTTRMELVRDLCRLATECRLVVAMHLAESEEELELLETAGGPFRDLLERLGTWEPAAFTQRIKLQAYLELLSQCHRSLVIHGNYLRQSHWQFLASRANKMAVVYCPRTHHFFQHRRYPLAAMLRAGVNVVIGTDSRASNPNLNLLDELRFAARRHPDVAPSELLQMGTQRAANALGLSDQIGTLTEGVRSDLAIVPLPHGAVSDPWEAVFDSDSSVSQTMVEGKFLDEGAV